ncbi:hypothetical protein C4D60_Mb09t04750 [Musa balbisiana]|uniref:BURP domain-containing protein n=1 Tax=Musa balbisiana TaxID=52838 RepID=A0A4S8IE42_MUSBA|nr:hypothetical protein C4D60_Mb09t04750 [Musa balbisiana]
MQRQGDACPLSPWARGCGGEAELGRIVPKALRSGISGIPRYPRPEDELKSGSGMRHLSRPWLRALTCFSERRTRALKQPYKAKASEVVAGEKAVGVGVNTGHTKPGGPRVNVGVGVGGTKHHRGTGVNVRVGRMPFVYRYAATDTQLHDDPNVALFFLNKDLRPGAKMTLHFTNTISGASFLPRRAADSIPFSSARLREILDRFSVEPNSAEAAEIKQTLRDCEEPAVRGERKTCATSLEAMVEFSTSSLGTSKVKAASTTVSKEGTPAQKYTVAASGVREMGGEELVTCHAEPYAYAIFYCHATSTSRGYEVAMVGKDGTTVEAAAVCHTDTSAWNPEHVAFKVLDIKPGSAPVCHFLPQDHVVWSRRG